MVSDGYSTSFKIKFIFATNTKNSNDLVLCDILYLSSVSASDISNDELSTIFIEKNFHQQSESNNSKAC